MSSKDYFSQHSKIYAAYRPVYPDALYNFIFRNLKHKNTAWDCGTGNGQVATYLANHFEKVFATDISQQQIELAPAISNIHYSIGSAEETKFQDRQFDLIAVGQALHWFDQDKFFKESKRVLKPGGLMAVWGYANLSVSPSIDNLFLNFYHNVVGAYWDEARRLVENRYQTINFPFKEIPSPEFQIKDKWNLSRLSGYITSWSATQQYIKAKKNDPVPDFIQSLNNLWSEEELKDVTFPVFLRCGYS